MCFNAPESGFAMLKNQKTTPCLFKRNVKQRVLSSHIGYKQR